MVRKVADQSTKWRGVIKEKRQEDGERRMEIKVRGDKEEVGKRRENGRRDDGRRVKKPG